MKVVPSRRKLVVHPQSLLAAGDQAGFAEICQMPRNGWLWRTDDSDQITDTQLTWPQKIENAKPRAIGKRTEHGVDTAFCCSQLHSLMRI